MHIKAHMKKKKNITEKKFSEFTVHTYVYSATAKSFFTFETSQDAIPNRATCLKMLKC